MFTTWFVAPPEKSVLQPTQSIEFLGFVTDSVKMTAKHFPQKLAKNKLMCYEHLSKQKPTTGEVAQVIGILVSRGKIWPSSLLKSRMRQSQHYKTRVISSHQ